MQFQTTDFSVPAFITVEQLARALQVSPATVRRWHAGGNLPVLPIRIGRRILFPARAVLALLGNVRIPVIVTAHSG